MVKNKDMQFFMENLKMKRKKDKKNLTFRSGDLNPRFSVIFPPMIWIFMEGEGDKIKSKQASKKDRTLPGCSFWLGENSPESRILLAEVDVVRPLLLEDAATDVTTVGCTVAVGGATTPMCSGAATPTGAPPTAPAADGADALEAVLPPGEADLISGPAGW